MEPEPVEAPTCFLCGEPLYSGVEGISWRECCEMYVHDACVQASYAASPDAIVPGVCPFCQQATTSFDQSADPSTQAVDPTTSAVDPSLDLNAPLDLNDLGLGDEVPADLTQTGVAFPAAFPAPVFGGQVPDGGIGNLLSDFDDLLTDGSAPEGGVVSAPSDLMSQFDGLLDAPAEPAPIATHDTAPPQPEDSNNFWNNQPEVPSQAEYLPVQHAPEFKPSVSSTSTIPEKPTHSKRVSNAEEKEKSLDEHSLSAVAVPKPTVATALLDNTAKPASNVPAKGIQANGSDIHDGVGKLIPTAAASISASDSALAQDQVNRLKEELKAAVTERNQLNAKLRALESQPKQSVLGMDPIKLTEDLRKEREELRKERALASQLQLKVSTLQENAAKNKAAEVEAASRTAILRAEAQFAKDKLALTKQLTSTQEKLSQATKEKHTGEENISALNKEIRKLKAEVAEKFELSRRVFEKDTHEKEWQQQKISLEAQLKAAEKRLVAQGDSEAQLKTAAAELSRAKAEASDYQRQLTEARQQLAAAQQVTSEQQKQKEQIVALRSTEAALRTQLAACEAEVEELGRLSRDKISALVEELGRKRDQLSSAMEAVEQQLAQDEAAVQHALAQAAQATEATRALSDTHAAEMAKAQANNQSLAARIDDLEAQLDEAETAKIELETELATTRAAVETANAQLVAQQEVEQQLSAARAAAEAAAQAANAELETSKPELQAVKNELKIAKAGLEASKTELETINSELAKTKDELKAKIHELTSTAGTDKAALAAANEALATANKTLAATKEAKLQVEALLEKLQSEITELRENDQEMRQASDALREREFTLEQEVDELRGEKGSLDRQLQEAKAQSSTAQTELEEIKAQLSAAQTETEETKAQLSTAQTELEETKAQLSSLETLKQQTSTSAASWESERVKLQTEVKSAKESLRQSEQKYKTLQQQITAAERDRKALEAQLAQAVEGSNSKDELLEAHKSEVEAAIQRVGALQEEREENTRTIQRLLDEEKRLRSQLEDQEQRSARALQEAETNLKQAANSDNEALVAEISRLRGEVSSEHTAFETQVSLLANEQTAHAQTQKDREELEQRLQEVESEKELIQVGLNGQVAKVEAQLRSSEERKAAIEREKEAAEERASAAEERLAVLEARVGEQDTAVQEAGDLREQLTQLQAQLATRTDEQAALQSKVQTLETKLAEPSQNDDADLRRDLQTAITARDELQTANTNLLQQLEQLNLKLAEASKQPEIPATGDSTAVVAELKAKLAEKEEEYEKVMTENLDLQTRIYELEEGGSGANSGGSEVLKTAIEGKAAAELRLRQADERLQQLTTAADSLKQELEQKTARVSSLESELANRPENSLTDVTRQEELKTQLQTTEQELVEAKELICTLQAELGELREKGANEAVKGESQDLDEKIKELTEQLSQLRQESEESSSGLNQQLEEEKRAKRQLELELETEKAKHTEGNTKFDEDKTQLEEDRTKLEEEKAKLDEEKSKLDQEKAKLDEDKAKLEDDKTKLAEDRERADDSHKDDKREPTVVVDTRLQVQVDHYKQVATLLKDAVEKRERYITLQAKESTRFKELNEKLKAEKAKLEQEKKALAPKVAPKKGWFGRKPVNDPLARSQNTAKWDEATGTYVFEGDVVGTEDELPPAAGDDGALPPLPARPTPPQLPTTPPMSPTLRLQPVSSDAPALLLPQASNSAGPGAKKEAKLEAGAPGPGRPGLPGPKMARPGMPGPRPMPPQPGRRNPPNLNTRYANSMSDFLDDTVNEPASMPVTAPAPAMPSVFVPSFPMPSTEPLLDASEPEAKDDKNVKGDQPASGENVDNSATEALEKKYRDQIAELEKQLQEAEVKTAAAAAAAAAAATAAAVASTSSSAHVTGEQDEGELLKKIRVLTGNLSKTTAQLDVANKRVQDLEKAKAAPVIKAPGPEEKKPDQEKDLKFKMEAAQREQQLREEVQELKTKLKRLQLHKDELQDLLHRTPQTQSTSAPSTPTEVTNVSAVQNGIQDAPRVDSQEEDLQGLLQSEAGQDVVERVKDNNGIGSVKCITSLSRFFITTSAVAVAATVATSLTLP